MLTCTNCGEKNPDNTSRCNKCGVALGHQARAKADASRSKVAGAFAKAGWIVALVVLVILAPKVYHASFAGYYRYRLNTVKEAAMKSCGGPYTDAMTSYQKTEIDHCMATDETLLTAQENYSNFTKNDKP